MSIVDSMNSLWQFMCLEWHPCGGRRCTLQPHHDGPHVAHGPGDIAVSAWSGTEEVDIPKDSTPAIQGRYVGGEPRPLEIAVISGIGRFDAFVGSLIGVTGLREGEAATSTARYHCVNESWKMSGFQFDGMIVLEECIDWRNFEIFQVRYIPPKYNT